MARRGHREGTIFFRPSEGRWCAAISLGYAGGKRRRKFVYGKTRGEVREKLTKTLRDLQLGIAPPDERRTVKQFLEKWLTDIAKPRLRPRTFVGYKHHVDAHICPEFGNTPLAKLGPEQIQRLLVLKTEELSARTAQYIHAVLRTALEQAVRWGYVPRNVAKLVTSPRVKRPEVKPLDSNQARKLLAVVEKHRLSALYTVAVALGLRQGEALGLRWEDVDLKAGQLVVRQSLQRFEGKLNLVDPKTERSRRAIALPRVCVESLKAHRVQQRKDRLLAGSRWNNEHGLVFTTRHGKPFDPRHLIRHFKAALKKAKLAETVRFHDLRHTCATLLLAQGVPMRVVMDVLGHSQMSITSDTYSHVLPALQKEAAERMDAALS